MNTTYRNLRIGAPKRLAYLRGYVESHNAKVNAGASGRLIDWRMARFGNFLSNDSGLSEGYNMEHGRKVPAYTTFDVDALPGRVYFADETDNPRRGRAYVDHCGYYTDDDCNETARPFFVRLTHGRYLAGYALSDNGEHVVFTTVYDDDRDAASAADAHARIYAEDAKEYDAKWQAARALESDIEDDEAARDALITRLKAAIQVRHAGAFWREEVRKTIDALRNRLSDIEEKQKRLDDEFKGVL